MLGNKGRDLATTIFTPFARVLNRFGVTPNAVTYVSTALVALLSILLLGKGHWVAGPAFLGVVLFADSVDGTLARLTGQASPYGAFLDSTMDRLGDGFVFGALVWWVATGWEPSTVRSWALAAGIAVIVLAAAVPYARAKAESVGVNAAVGMVERTDRLVIALAGAFLTGVGLSDWVFVGALIVVAIGSAITVLQRMMYVARALSGKIDRNKT